jgi:hypothetical protein
MMAAGALVAEVRNAYVIGDRAYDAAAALRERLKEQGYQVVIPVKPDSSSTASIRQGALQNAPTRGEFLPAAEALQTSGDPVRGARLHLRRDGDPGVCPHVATLKTRPPPTIVARPRGMELEWHILGPQVVRGDELRPLNSGTKNRL